MGGATGEAYTNTLYGTGMEPAAMLARESIQNSVDASAGSEKVRVVFRRTTLSGLAKKRFIDTLRLDTEYVRRKKVLEYQQNSCIEGINNDSEVLHLLYIEDYQTHGLYGPPHDPKSHFFRLLLSLGDGAKSRGENDTGGSYGYGKSVYSANSRIHTIVAYSVFDPKLDGTGEHARLMGCGYFNAHDFDKTAFSGRAWFGVPKTESRDVVDPLANEKAHEVAEILGFTRRVPSQTGTSILIVDCPVDCDELRSSIEEWWWPRILDESVGLDIVLQEQGVALSPPRPRLRPDLKPIIRCYEMAIGRANPTGKSDKSGQLNRMDNLDLGSYGYTILGDSDANEDKIQSKINRIALIRRPRMVVSYFDVGGTLPLPCVGVFVADPKIDKPLKISEPASHDKWDPNSARLNNLPEEKRAVVSAVLHRLKTGLRRFSSDAAPPAPMNDLRLKALEKLLGSIFKPPLAPGERDGAKHADPIRIQFVDQPHVVPDEDGLSMRGSFRLSLDDDAERDEIEATLHVQCLIMEDEGVSKEDPIVIEISSGDVDMFSDPVDLGKGRFKLAKSERPIFKFRTRKYPVDWTACVRVNVGEIE